MPVAELARQTGLSPTTIRYLGMSARPNGVTLVAISAVLGWRCDHLGNILRGEPGKNVRVRPPAQADLLLSVRAESMALREQVQALRETVLALDRKMTAVQAGLPERRAPAEARVAVLPAPDDMDGDYSPQYVRLARRVRAGIESGALRHRDPVRAADLSAQQGVSGPVACAALRMLAANGYVNKPGRFHSYEVADLRALVPGSA